MKSAMQGRRAARALRWYPAAWRARFGDEFVALLEDEAADRPRSLRRTLNVAWKGSLARLADLGLVGRTLDPARQVQAGVATTTLFGLLFAAGALKLWAESMVDWNALREPSPWGVTLTTGVMTVALSAIVVALAIGFAAMLVSVVRHAVKDRGTHLWVPIAVLVISASALSLSVHSALRFVIARGGIQWAHPGEAIKQVAGASFVVVQSFEWAATTRAWHTSLDGAMYAVSPLFLVAFALATVSLVRQIEFSPRVARLGRLAMVATCTLMAIFLAAFVLWEMFGGNAAMVFTQGRSFPVLAVTCLGVLVAGGASCLAQSRCRILR